MAIKELTIKEVLKKGLQGKVLTAREIFRGLRSGELKDAGVWSGDGVIYEVHGDKGYEDLVNLRITSPRRNPIFQNPNAAFKQLAKQGFYLPKRWSDYGVVPHNFCSLDLKDYPEEKGISYIDLDAENLHFSPDRLNLFRDLYGEKPAEVLRGLYEMGIESTRVFLFSPETVKARLSKKENSFAVGCWVSDRKHNFAVDPYGGDMTVDDTVLVRE